MKPSHKARYKLSPLAVANAKPRTTDAAKPSLHPYRLADGGGLYLEVWPSGRKNWTYRYSLIALPKPKRLKKPKEGEVTTPAQLVIAETQPRRVQDSMPLGDYPETTLAEARDKFAEAEKLRKKGVNPKQPKLDKKAALIAESAKVETDRASTFENVALDWAARAKGKAPKTVENRMRRLNKDLFPTKLGELSVRAIDRPLLLEVLEELHSRKPEIAKKALRDCRAIFERAIDKGLITTNPCPLASKLEASEVVNRPAIVEPEGFATLLRMIDGYQGSIVVRSALMLAPLVFARPGELCNAKWSDINFETKTWRHTMPKVKRLGKDRYRSVPLPAQAIAILENLRPHTQPLGDFVFLGQRPGRPISDNTLNASLRTLGIDTKAIHCAHGFRASARTMLEDPLMQPIPVIRNQLGHLVEGQTDAAYARAEYLKQSRTMLQIWANYLEALRSGSGEKFIDALHTQENDQSERKAA